MYSRYDVMLESDVVDEVDQVGYPDPLSVNFNNVNLTEVPKLRTLSSADLNRFWLFILKHYQEMAEGDDLVLTLNGVPYLGMLNPGDQIYLPIASNLYGVKNISGLA